MKKKRGFIGEEGESEEAESHRTLSPQTPSINPGCPIGISLSSSDSQGFFSEKISLCPDASKSHRNGGNLLKGVRTFNARQSGSATFQKGSFPRKES